MARRDERGPGNDKMSDAAPESKVSYLPAHVRRNLMS